MDQSDQNTPAQQEPVIDDSAEVVATPGLGLAKGIIAISLGVGLLVMIFLLVLSAEVFFLAVLSPFPMKPDASLFAEPKLPWLLAPTVSGSVPFGLCLWRGILAIRYRKVRRVTRLNFGLWLGFFILIVLPVIGSTVVGLILFA